MNVTINQNNTIHRAFVGGSWIATVCNREPHDLNNRRRQPYVSEYDVTCKKCLKILAAEITENL